MPPTIAVSAGSQQERIDRGHLVHSVGELDPENTPIRSDRMQTPQTLEHGPATPANDRTWEWKSFSDVHVLHAEFELPKTRVILSL